MDQYDLNNLGQESLNKICAKLFSYRPSIAYYYVQLLKQRIMTQCHDVYAGYTVRPVPRVLEFMNICFVGIKL